MEGHLITTPRQDAAIHNFVGTFAEVRQFMQAHRTHLFYIDINPTTPPNGARQFRITAFPLSGARQVIDALHPEAGDPLMTPAARQALQNQG